MLLTVCLLLSSTSVMGNQGNLLTNQEFIRLGTKTISAGDSVKKVLDAGGEPETRTPIINRFGVEIAQEWTYYGGARSTIIIRVSGGAVDFVATRLNK
jgi:hypothetical protein